MLPIPLSPKEGIGSLNLRGRIVTAVDIRAILGIESDIDINIKNTMNVVVEFNNDLYSIIVDSIGEVINISVSSLIKNPSNLQKEWFEVADGVVPLENNLLVIIDVDKLLKKFKTEESEDIKE